MTLDTDTQTTKLKRHVLQIPLPPDQEGERVWVALHEMAKRANLPLATWMRSQVIIPLADGKMVSSISPDDLLSKPVMTLENFPRDDYGLPDLDAITYDERQFLREEWNKLQLRGEMNPFLTDQERIELENIHGS